jgi:hypothetical protein
MADDTGSAFTARRRLAASSAQSRWFAALSVATSTSAVPVTPKPWVIM